MLGPFKRGKLRLGSGCGVWHQNGKSASIFYGSPSLQSDISHSFLALLKYILGNDPSQQIRKTADHWPQLQNWKKLLEKKKHISWDLTHTASQSQRTACTTSWLHCKNNSWMLRTAVKVNPSGLPGSHVWQWWRTRPWEGCPGLDSSRRPPWCSPGIGTWNIFMELQNILHFSWWLKKNS